MNFLNRLSLFLGILASSIVIPGGALAGSPVIFQGAYTRTLTDHLTLNSTVDFIQGTADPTAGAGVAAARGSLYLRTGATNNHYVKTGAADTAWSQVLTGSGAFTADRAMQTDGSGNLQSSSTISTTELGYLNDVSSALCGINQSCTVTNKAIDADTNTLTNIENADIKAAAAIDATKIADGSVTSAEFQRINTLSSNAQDQLTTNATAISDHLADTSDAHDASAVSVSAVSGLAATDVQAALAEHQGDIDDHLADTADAHDASAISVSAISGLTATEVQAALAEHQGDVETNATNISNHLADTTDAHDASAVSFAPAGTIAGTDAQTAIAEVATDAASALSTHEADSTSVHGITDSSLLALGVASAVDGEVALFNSTGGKQLKRASGTGPAKLTSGVLSAAAIDLGGAEVTGTLGVANGGTGAASLTANNVLLGNGTAALQVVAPGSSGNVLTSNGTTWTSAAPAAATAYTSSQYIDRATVAAQCTSSPCTITSQTGTWLSSISQGVSGTGTYILNFNVAYSSAPTCVVNAESGMVAIRNPSATSTTAFYFKTFNTAGAAANTSFDVICMGPR